ncbi:hypothetical protein OB955_01605 [Halobacteria archaeon AArc-m2/3/4]|uniref:Uncharacterized protein n=1 Tax=Natronoglomus mannanivorans TaxID=2979990 RepID=A0AAP2YW61_9EURY|nr:hypothetical protein [Halobacteria archaeon AArc-xg1-1]MCU4971436.1 hypothetical protein [Halobacteria archaeon AArc-m2/3/4]
MVSRDTAVHICAVVAAFLLLVVIEYAGAGSGADPAPFPVFLLFYGLVLGGAHLYLAIRGESGLVPVEARWRYVAMLAVLLGAGAVIFYGGDRTVGTVRLEQLGFAIVVVTIVAYFLTESIAGYRESRSG